MKNEFNDKTRPTGEIQPVVRWAGSKRKTAQLIVSHMPNTYTKYIEPFCGSACVFFRVSPNSAVLGDFNQELINFYIQATKHPVSVYMAVSKIPKSSSSYYRIRALCPIDMTKMDRAVRFYFLNRLCFNGVYRTNNSGAFNVPMGENTGGLPSKADFLESMRFIRERAELVCADYRQVVSQAHKGDFIYLDPPYSTFGVQNRGEYGHGTFNKDDIPELLSVLLDRSKVGVKFLLSYSNSTAVRRFAEMNGWNCSPLKVKRHVSGFAQHRKVSSEILVWNYRNAID